MKTILTCTLTKALPVGTVIRVDEHESMYSLEYDIIERRSACLAMSGEPAEVPTPQPVVPPQPVVELPVSVETPSAPKKRKQIVFPAYQQLRERITSYFRAHPGTVSSTSLAFMLYGATPTDAQRQQLHNQLHVLRAEGIIENRIPGKQRSSYWWAVTK